MPSLIYTLPLILLMLLRHVGSVAQFIAFIGIGLGRLVWLLLQQQPSYAHASTPVFTLKNPSDSLGLGELVRTSDSEDDEEVVVTDPQDAAGRSKSPFTNRLPA